MLYNNLSGYFKRKYGQRLRKICIDGGFSCPNRDGTVGRGGCIFCSERGSGEHIERGKSINEQVNEGLLNNGLYVAYFQNFTNTYAELDILKKRYDEALIDERIVALAIGTRPDCINEKIAELIASYKERVDVWVELGLQSANDETAKTINRGYKTEVYKKAVEILHGYGIPVVTHIMIGLPGEDKSHLEETVKTVVSAGSEGIKIHSVYIARGTRLAELYKNGEYHPIELDEYVDGVVYTLSHISPETVVHRLTGDCRGEMLVAPSWSADKNLVLGKIVGRMNELGIKQGDFYSGQD